MIKVKDFPIFEAGSYAQGEFDEAKVEEIVSSYDPKKLTAGAVLGHSSDYDTKVPNMGIVYGLKKIGKQIWTNGVELAEALVQAIKEKSVKYPSVELYKPEDPANPVQGKYYLGNIGFLGAKNPAVKGLPLLASALGFTEKHPSLISIEQPAVEFVGEEELIEAANKDTYEKIELEFAQCLRKIEEYLAGTDSDEDKMSKCNLAVFDCSNAVQGVIKLHYNFTEKAESVLEKISNSLSEMVEKLKGNKHHNTQTMEAEMNQKEFQEAQATLDTRKAELDKRQADIDAKAAEFAEQEKVSQAAEAKAAEARVDAEIVTFKEELGKGNFPVKKMEDEGLFVLAKHLLSANELQFGEQKKKPMDVLKALIATFKPVPQGTEFKEEDIKTLADTARKIGIPAGASFSPEGLAKVQFAEQYLAKNKDTIPGESEKEKLANVMTRIMMGEIKFDPKQAN